MGAKRGRKEQKMVEEEKGSTKKNCEFLGNAPKRLLGVFNENQVVSSTSSKDIWFYGVFVPFVAFELLITL